MRVEILFGVLVAFLINEHGVTGQLGLGKYVDSVKQITSGVARDVGNLIPSPETIFESSKNLIVGYPFEAVAASINKICSTAVGANSIAPKVTPKIDKMNFELRTACGRHSFPLKNAEEMWKSPHFDKSKRVVLLITGWTTSVNNTEHIDIIAKPYHCRGDTNFVVLDAAGFIDTLYTWSAFNTDAIGEYVAAGLKQLIAYVPVEKIHLIGHSLGAHICGAAARYFHEGTGKKIPRVTGLDPAKPCFNEGESLSGLLRGDAEFVDIIHSNPGVLGKRDPMGDVDFYPGGLDPLPKGCYDISCAHSRAWQYYAESAYPGNEHNFLGKRCTSLTHLRTNKCKGEDVPMGYIASPDKKGNYFLEIASSSPYGRDADGIRTKKLEDCGSCKE